jgi:Domain of unknown function (DUF4411)
MLAAAPVYCIDTSSILVWFVDTYPPMVFPGLLARVEGLIDGGRLCAPRAVLDEIRPGDACHKWCKEQPALFLEEPVSVQRIVTRLMTTHHDPARPTKGISGADPFVIVMAKDTGPHCMVVADEHPGSRENRKIPFVCNHENVRCITFQQMMLTEGWQFR